MPIRKHIRYRFDNLMARGVLAQILLLAIATLVLVGITVLLIVVFDVVPENEAKEHDSSGMLAWKSLMHALDAGTLSGDSASWTYLLIMLFITIGGLFVLSALIGVLNQGFGQMLDDLRRGRSAVIEKDHTVILGWTPKIGTLLTELVEANRNKRGACVVILANRDKVEMDAEVIDTLGRGAPIDVVTRSGSPMSTADLEIASVSTSRAVIVLAPETDAGGAEMAPHEADTVVLKTLLALSKAAPGGIEQLHVVVEISDPRTEAVARMVAGPGAALILATPLISRLLVQTGRQSGLSVVYSELLAFEGNEIYVCPEPALAGARFRDAVHRYGTSSLIGVLSKGGEILVPPDFDRVFDAADQVIAISHDDDTVVLDGDRPAGDLDVIAKPRPPATRGPDRTLVLGVGTRLPVVLAELDQYVAPGSETVVVGGTSFQPPGLANMKVTSRVGDVTDRAVLESLSPTTFDHVLVLSETTGRSQEMADARTTVALLHLRDISRITGKKVPITSEILEIDNRDLATVAEADDFIVSNTLVSQMMSQVAENRHLVKVFDVLFSAEGHEIYLKPATDYVEAGEHAFATVCEAALRQNHIAIGYRLAASARDAAASYGVAINPPKSRRVKLGPADKLIVIAEE